MTWLESKREELYRIIERELEEGEYKVINYDLYRFIRIIDDMERTIKSMQSYELQLEGNCQRWAEINQSLITAGDTMVMVSKSKKHRKAWFDAKARYVIKPSK